MLLNVLLQVKLPVWITGVLGTRFEYFWNNLCPDIWCQVPGYALSVLRTKVGYIPTAMSSRELLQQFKLLFSSHNG